MRWTALGIRTVKIPYRAVSRSVYSWRVHITATEPLRRRVRSISYPPPPLLQRLLSSSSFSSSLAQWHRQKLIITRCREAGCSCWCGVVGCQDDDRCWRHSGVWLRNAPLVQMLSQPLLRRTQRPPFDLITRLLPPPPTPQTSRIAYTTIIQ